MTPEQKEVEQLTQVLEACDRMSRECERGVLFFRSDGKAGIAQVAPNCLMLAESFLNGAMIVDSVLN